MIFLFPRFLTLNNHVKRRNITCLHAWWSNFGTKARTSRDTQCLVSFCIKDSRLNEISNTKVVCISRTCSLCGIAAIKHSLPFFHVFHLQGQCTRFADVSRSTLMKRYISAVSSTGHDCLDESALVRKQSRPHKPCSLALCWACSQLSWPRKVIWAKGAIWLFRPLKGHPCVFTARTAHRHCRACLQKGDKNSVHR